LSPASSITLSTTFRVSLQSVRNRLRLWNECLPNIRPFYAVKSNNLAPILAELHKGGCGFDCASVHEVRAAQAVGASAQTDIVYANPCKSRQQLGEAGVSTVTFDSLFELQKIHEIIRSPRPVIRIFVDDKGGARIPLNKKFGFHIRNVHELLHREPFFTICGLAFHVGSDCTSVKAYQSAFDTVRQFVDAFKGNTGFRPDVLDIGGGFSGNSANDGFFRNELAPLIRHEMKTLPFETVIAEPGRFFAEESCSLTVPVIGRKVMPDGTHSITIDESVYGVFSGVLFDGFKPTFHCRTRKPYGEMVPHTVFGRTCDSADVIAKDVWLPKEIDDSDVLDVPNIGAYSWVSLSTFNGFEPPTIQVLS
jgi:ornithine decarboxylase